MMYTSLKSRSSVLALLAICTLAPLPALAQAAAMATPPSFVPVNGWTVGSTELALVRGLKDVKLPCVLSAEYDNGYVVRFSGGGNHMLALAIDFRQNAFTQGQKYQALLSVGDGYVKQISTSAFTPSTLIFNLRELPDFYGTLKGAKKFSLDIEGNSFEFSLQQLAQNFGALEACYTTGNAAPIQPVSAPLQQSVDAGATPISIVPTAPQQQNLPRTFDDIMTAEPETPAAMKTTAAKMQRTDTVAPRASTVSRAPAADTIWRASAGEDMRSVLSRWSDAAGYDLQWQASDNGKVVQDVAVTGRFEDAVSQLLAENRAGTGIKGQFDNGASVNRSTTLASSLPASASWSAVPGADLKSVVNDWATRAGVAVVWKSSGGMPPVKSAINQSGSFESALQALLDQYSADSARPVGQLNVDPATKKRTLLLELDKTS